MPHVFAGQVEYVDKNLKYRDGVVLSLHPHNDRGCGVATAEMGILAGADRIEGTLFGNGERTGNVDIVTLALNMFSQGVDPGLDFTDIPKIREIYERLTRMHVYERQPYAGDLVFTAFSGSHQDAIAKGMAWREAEERDHWTVPYLPIDPKDIGRTYDKDVIRINSQSGKGGVSYILKQNFGISVPKEMREEVGYMVKDVSDKAHKELTPDWVYHIFEDHYVNYKGIFSIDECHFKQEDGIIADATISHANGKRVVTAGGNGRLDAVSNAIKQYFGISYELSFYEEHSLTRGSSSKACAYVGVICNGKTYWGVGIDADIIKASIEALTVAVNKIDELKNVNECKDERMVEIMNYIQANYLDVSLDDLAEKFFLSKPYLSKYIKENPSVIIKTILTTAIQFIIYYSIPYWVYCAFNLKGFNIFQIITLQSVLFATVSGIPSPGAVGVSEGGFMSIFKTVFPSSVISSSMILTRGINFYFYVLLSGIVVIVSTLKSKKEEKNENMDEQKVG